MQSSVIITNINTWALEIAGFSAAIIILFKTFKRYEKMTKAIEAYAKLDSLIVSVASIASSVDEMKKEFHPNGGGSFKDALNRLEHRASSIETSLAFGQIAIRSFVNQGNSGYVITDETGATIEVSLSVCRMLHRTEDELLGFKYYSYIHPEELEDWDKGIKFALENKTNMNKDCRMLLPGEEHTYIKINNFAQRIESNGKLAGYYIAVTKI